jgi:hypothetical protein
VVAELGEDPGAGIVGQAREAGDDRVVGVLLERVGGGVAEFVDLAAFDAERRQQGECLAAHGAVNESWENSVATMYVDGRMNEAGVPDHELQVAVDYKDRTTGALRYVGDGGTYFTAGGQTKEATTTYYYMGHDRDFPSNAALPVDEVRRAAKDFSNGGHRPTAVE